MITAFSGTSKLRNTAINNKNESESTPINRYGIRLPIAVAKSEPAAVKPPIFASAPLAGTTSLLKRFTKL